MPQNIKMGDKMREHFISTLTREYGCVPPMATSHLPTNVRNVVFSDYRMSHDVLCKVRSYDAAIKIARRVALIHWYYYNRYPCGETSSDYARYDGLVLDLTVNRDYLLGRPVSWWGVPKYESL